MPASTILELFGAMFFDFCEESGYEKILTVLGATTWDFLQNLDTLHDHLQTIYPGMNSPSFCCTERPEDGATILHYYSEREGLEYIVIGLVKAVAKKLHSSEVNVEIYKTKADGIDHVQFLITSKYPREHKPSSEVEAFEHSLSNEPKISPKSFCKAFPFHLMFDNNMCIMQAGKSIARMMPQCVEETNCKITQLFDMARPHMDFTFQSILSHVNTVYVLCAKVEDEEGKPRQNSIHTSTLRLKGEMISVPEAALILFVCSPVVMNLDDLNRKGMFLSDIPLHDATRDLFLLSEQFEVEYKLTRKLEIMTDQLQQTLKQLEDEKKKTDTYNSLLCTMIYILRSLNMFYF